VLAEGGAQAEIGRNLRGDARRFRQPWFSRLLDQPDGVWLGLLLRDHAEERGEVDLAAARRRAWLNRNSRFREWSRRQNRPVALSWAVAGVALMMTVCALLVSVSDMSGAASDAAVLNAWVATVFAGGAALAAEAVLAWEIGGRFHPRYSTLGGAFIALGRAARSVAGRRLSLVLTVAVGAVAFTAFLPMLTPVVAGVATVAWAVPRYLRWRTDFEREQAEAAQGAEELHGRVRTGRRPGPPANGAVRQ
jgi:hypothetical protein